MHLFNIRANWFIDDFIFLYILERVLFSDLIAKRRTPLFRLNIEKEGGRGSGISGFARQQRTELIPVLNSSFLIKKV